MDGGDLMTKNRPVRGGDLQTMSRQHGGFLGFLGKLFGLGASDMQKQMQDPVKQQMMMQRGGFPWALAGLSILPMLMGKGEEDGIQRQMKTTRDPIMQRGGLSIPPLLYFTFQRLTSSDIHRPATGYGCIGLGWR